MSRDWHYCNLRRDIFQEKETEYSEKFIITDINFCPSADTLMMSGDEKSPTGDSFPQRGFCVLSPAQRRAGRLRV